VSHNVQLGHLKGVVVTDRPPLPPFFKLNKFDFWDVMILVTVLQ